MRLRPTLAALVVTVTLLGACSSATTSPEDPTGQGAQPRIDLDPERYVRDYEERDIDAGMTGAPNPSATSASAADDAGVTEALPPRPPTPFEDNTFVDPGENPFVDARTQPASTFGLDVDTGSFSVGRTFLTQGTLPPPASTY